MDNVEGSDIMCFKKRSRDLVVEILVAALLVVAFIAYVVKTHKTGVVRNFTPIIQIGNAAIVFGYLISWFRFAWRNAVFWLVMGALLLGHAALCIFVLGPIPRLPLASYAVIDMIELALFSQILRKITA
jgi:hypothetical protein